MEQSSRVEDDNEETMDPTSQYELGKYLELSLERDLETAFELYIKSANNGLLEVHYFILNNISFPLIEKLELKQFCY
jgi:hypothetical protein